MYIKRARLNIYVVRFCCFVLVELVSRRGINVCECVHSSIYILLAKLTVCWANVFVNNMRSIKKTTASNDFGWYIVWTTNTWRFVSSLTWFRQRFRAVWNILNSLPYHFNQRNACTHRILNTSSSAHHSCPPFCFFVSCYHMYRILTIVHL